MSRPSFEEWWASIEGLVSEAVNDGNYLTVEPPEAAAADELARRMEDSDEC